MLPNVIATHPLLLHALQQRQEVGRLHAERAHALAIALVLPRAVLP